MLIGSKDSTNNSKADFKQIPENANVVMDMHEKGINPARRSRLEKQKILHILYIYIYVYMYIIYTYMYIYTYTHRLLKSHKSKMGVIYM